jgi:hypothetical protein
MTSTLLTVAESSEARVVGQLGRQSAQLPVSLGWIDKYVALPEAPAVCQREQFVSIVWGMLGNDRYGDCTFAAWVHLVMAVAALLDLEISVPSAEAVVRAYLTFTHGLDSGAVESQVLQTATSTGLCGFRSVGYAASKGDLAELWSIVNTFGAAYLGGMLTASDQRQFQAGEPWSLTSDKAIIGGHAFPVLEYDQHAELAKVLTWGKEQLVTFEWLSARIDEKWCVIPEQVKIAGTLDGFDWSQLESDLKAMPGAVVL